VKKLFLFLALLACPLIAEAQTHTFPALDTDNAFTGSNSYTKPVILTPTTVAGLPAASTVQGALAAVTDGSSATDCTVGSGSTVVFCKSDGSTWSVVGSPSASVAFSALTTGTNTSAAMHVGTGASLNTTGAGTIAATTSAALASSPSQCTGTQFAQGIATSGNANCATPASAALGIYATNPTYNLPASGFFSCAASYSNASTTLTTNATYDPSFDSSMIGWFIMASNEDCQGTLISNSGTVHFVGTISSINNAHSVVLSGTPSGTCTTNLASKSCQMWTVPSDSAAALNAAWADATLAIGKCPTLILPAGVYKINTAVQTTNKCGIESGLVTNLANRPDRS